MRRRVKLTYSLLVASFAFGVFSPSTRADIVLEFYVDRRPSDTERSTLDRLKAALESRGMATKPAQVLAQAGNLLPRSGHADQDLVRVKLIERIGKAASLAAHEAYDEAVAILEPVLRELDNDPVLAASDPESRSWITKARVTLAVSYARINKLKPANKIIADHIRCYPEVSLVGEREEVERLFNANMEIARKVPPGKLVFAVDRTNAQIFVNGVARGRGKIDLELAPGEHSIVVLEDSVYRSYKIPIRSNETTARTVNWSVDSAFTAAPSWIGFVAPNRARRGVATFVQQVAEQMPGAAVILIGIHERDGQRYLVANRYEPAPAPHRPERAIELTQASAAQIEALATYVATSKFDLSMSASPTNVVPHWPLVVAATVFSASVPAGSYLLRIRDNCDGSCSQTRRLAGLGLIGLGGLALGFGVLWIVHEEHATSSSPLMLDIQPLPGGGVARISGAF